MNFGEKVRRRMAQKAKLKEEADARLKEFLKGKTINFKPAKGNRFVSPGRPKKSANGLKATGASLGRLTPEVAKALTFEQADRLVRLFGSPYKLCAAVNRLLAPNEKPWHPSTVYRWTYPKGYNRGRGGEIPVNKIKTILKAARLEGILIAIEDLYPKLFD